MSDKPDEIQWIDEIWETWRGRCSTSEEQEWKIRFDAIRSLIEHGPEVDEAWIRGIIREIVHPFDKETVTDRYIVLIEIAEKLLKDKLLAIGVTVKERG